MTKLRDYGVIVLFRIVLVFLRLYKWIHLLGVKIGSSYWRKLIINKFRSVGVTVNGDQPWDIQILDERFYDRFSQDRTLGLGESYMDGWWKCKDIVTFCTKMGVAEMMTWCLMPWQKLAYYAEFDMFNHQTVAKSHEVAEGHYDLGNDFFQSFLDPSMTYTCAYWKRAKNLEEAQIDKMELIAQKLKLKPGMRVLDIGCGWGGLCHYLASKYKVSVVGCTVGVEGAKLAQERCQGLPVDIRVADYRTMDELFDRIVSVGMFEHVGNHNFDEYFQVVHRCLKERGLFVLQTIGTYSDKLPRIDPWYNTYIFPNGRLPHAYEVTKCANGLFVLEDWHNFGPDYAKTLIAWHENFEKNWPLVKHRFESPDRIYRMWKVYLLASAGGFQARKVQLWQIVFSKGGQLGGYESPR